MAPLCRYCDRYYSPSDPTKIIGCDCEGAKKARADKFDEQIKKSFSRLRVRGISRVGDNDKVLMLSFDRPPTDDEMSSIHEVVRRNL